MKKSKPFYKKSLVYNIYYFGCYWRYKFSN